MGDECIAGGWKSCRQHYYIIPIIIFKSRPEIDHSTAIYYVYNVCVPTAVKWRNPLQFSAESIYLFFNDFRTFEKKNIFLDEIKNNNIT